MSECWFSSDQQHRPFKNLLLFCQRHEFLMKHLGEVPSAGYEIIFTLLYCPSCPTICDPTGEFIELVAMMRTHMAPIAQVLVDDQEPAELQSQLEQPTDKGQVFCRIVCEGKSKMNEVAVRVWNLDYDDRDFEEGLARERAKQWSMRAAAGQDIAFGHQ